MERESPKNKLCILLACILANLTLPLLLLLLLTGLPIV
jgi:hypothetical protein